MDKQVELVVDAKAALGEGPSWDAEKQCLYWVDIMGQSFHIYTPSTGDDREIKTDQMIGAIVRKEKSGFIAAMQNGFVELDEEGHVVRHLADPESDFPNHRFNDGKCDRLGRFWAGTMSINGPKGLAALYRYDPDGTVTKMIDRITTSNGLAWSPDLSKFYYIDTGTKQIWAYEYNEMNGSIQNKTIIKEFQGDEGVPDGMTIDAEGNLWVAHWGGYKVSCINPQSGTTLDEIRIPAKQVTSCVFGGEHLDELYITTARTGLDEAELKQYPYSGGLFRIKTDVKGSATHFFAG